MRLWICGLAVLLPAGALRAEEAKPVAVPYKLTATNHVMVRVKINNKGPFNFIVDTGAPALFVSKEIAKKAGVTPDGEGWGKFDRFELEGGLVVEKATGKVDDLFQLKGMNGMGLAGVELHGVLGYNILARYRIQYDFTTDKLQLTKLDFDPPPPPALGRGAKQDPMMEMLGEAMKFVGPLLGLKGVPERKPRGFLGIELAAADDGVEVKSVLAGSPADKAGLKPGDKILKFKSEKIDLVTDLVRVVGKRAAGDELTLTVSRGGDEKKITVALGKGL